MKHSPHYISERTFACDLLKSPAAGIIESGWLSFTLLVAIRHFHAPESLKAAINAGPCIGLFLTPFSLYFASRFGFRPNRASAWYVGLGSLLLVAMALAPSLLWLAIFFIGCAMLFPQRVPLDTQIYSQNYAPADRGRLVSTSFVLKSLAGGAFGYFGGRLLDVSTEWYPWLFGVMAIAGGLAAIGYSSMPSQPLHRGSSGNPWQNFALTKTDPLFGYMLFAWMILGIGNLMTLPIRIEYIANPKYGINASNTTTAIVIIVIPLLFRVLSTRMWGKIFDRINLITTRNLVNFFFLASILCFFSTDNLWIMSVGSVLFGLALGGAHLLWSLWVTKIAPKDKVPAYQSVHSSMAGIRGIVSPFIGYALLTATNPRIVSYAGAALILIAIILFARMGGHERMAAQPTEIA